MRRVVVLPQPEGPRRLKNSPSLTSRSTWSTAMKPALGSAPSTYPATLRPVASPPKRLVSWTRRTAMSAKWRRLLLRRAFQPTRSTAVCPLRPSIGTANKRCQTTESLSRGARQRARFAPCEGGGDDIPRQTRADGAPDRQESDFPPNLPQAHTSQEISDRYAWGGNLSATQRQRVRGARLRSSSRRD